MPTLIQQPNSYSKGIKDEHEQKAVSCRVAGNGGRTGDIESCAERWMEREPRSESGAY
jgi:hypothetical protein